MDRDTSDRLLRALREVVNRLADGSAPPCSPRLATAGPPPYTMHDLRRACATILLARGEQPDVVQQQIGDSDVRTALDIYAKVTTAMSAKTATTMSAKAATTMNKAFHDRESRRSAS